MKDLISIIVPIYNVEKYLNRCIDSILCQTYTALEVILVDDGSPDNCPQMCEDWAKRDSRIKVIHKENAGLGMARNSGIDAAAGKYICFFDSDDYIAPKTIEKAYLRAKADNTDLVLFGSCRVEPNGDITNSFAPCTEKSAYYGDEVQNYVLPNLIAPNPKTGKRTNLCMSAWSYMYSMELIKSTGWRFASEREYISEDYYSLLCLYKYVSGVSIISEPLYYYCKNENSLTHTYQKNRFKRIMSCYNASMQICDESGYNTDVKNRLAFQYFGNIVGTMKLIVTADCSKKERFCALSDIVNDTEFQNMIHEMYIKKQPTARRILLIAMRKKLCRIVYMLVKAKA